MRAAGGGSPLCQEIRISSGRPRDVHDGVRASGLQTNSAVRNHVSGSNVCVEEDALGPVEVPGHDL